MQSIKHAIFFDCEFLVDDGSQQRFWCGPYDPDPTVVQVGAIKLRLDRDFDIQAAFHELILPINRAGDLQNISQAFSDLTGLSQEKVEREGIKLDKALKRFESFSGGAPIFSWGKDELNLIAISCFVSNLAFPIPATQFGNVCNLMLKAGMPYDDIKRTRSGALAEYFGLATENLRAHDARDDAKSIALVVQHLLRTGKLLVTDLKL